MQISSMEQAIAPTDQFENLFCDLYTSQKKVLYEFVLSRVHIPAVAEDIVQDVFVKLWSLKEKYGDTVEDYASFIFRMAHNEAISYLRRDKISQAVFHGIRKQTINAYNLTEEVVCEWELEVILQQAIQKLSPQRRKVYVLRKMEDVPFEQIARSMGIAIRTAKEMMRLSNQQVRKYINEQMDMKRKRKYNCTKKATIKTAIVKVKRLEAA